MHLTITNTSSIAGTEVVELYVSDPECSMRRPLRELKGFTKVHLHPRESCDITILLDRWALAYYDDSISRWTAEKGEFIVQAARSSREEHEMSRCRLSLGRTFTWTGLSKEPKTYSSFLPK